MGGFPGAVSAREMIAGVMGIGGNSLSYMSTRADCGGGGWEFPPKHFRIRVPWSHFNTGDDGGHLGHLSTREQYCGGGGWEFFGYWWEFFKLYEH